MLVGQVGCDDVEEPAAEDPQGLRVVLGGRVDQVPFGLDDEVGVEVVGQLLDRAEDHVRLLGPEVAGGEGVADDGRGCRGRSRGAHARPPRTGSSWSGAPASSRSTWHRRREPTWSSSACARDPGTELDDLRLEPGQLHQRRRRLVSGHRPHRRVHHTVGDAAHLRGRRGHLVVGCGHRCHGSTQARDHRQSEAQNGLIHRVQGHEQVTIRRVIHSRVAACGASNERSNNREGHRRGLEAQARALRTSTTGWLRPESRATTATHRAPYPAWLPVGGQPERTRRTRSVSGGS